MFSKLQQWIKHGNHLGIFCLVVAIGLAVSGGVSIIRGLNSQRAVAETKNLGNIPQRPNVQPDAGLYLSFSAPVKLRIPVIGVTSSLTTVGRAGNGEIDAPRAPDFDKAAWYHGSPAPGQYGASVIVGHVDSYDNNNGASVFYNLGKLKPGDVINVERSDKTTAIFKVYATRQFDRANIPTEQVYNANSADAELRLITCAGSFDDKTDQYSSNTIIFAAMIESRKSG